MQQFIVKSMTAKQEISKPHFFVLNKGFNSGKPILVPCPNCFLILAETEESKEILYWLSFALWRSNSFHPYLIGSVIPFIRIDCYKKLIIEKMEVVKSKPAEFAETIKNLNFIEMKEKQLKENLKLVQELKQAYANSYFYKMKK